MKTFFKKASSSQLRVKNQILKLNSTILRKKAVEIDLLYTQKTLNSAESLYKISLSGV